MNKNKSKKLPLGSFILHPQIKCGHPNKETEKLTNHDSDGSSGGGTSTTPSGPPNLDPSGVSSLKTAFGG